MNIKKINWGIISTAKIGRQKVIPGIQKSAMSEVLAIASRDADQARRTADHLQIDRSYGSYEELLADPDVDAVYNPLPNHLHVDWTLKAMHAGKHVLCEKPIGLDANDANRLLAASERHPEIKVMEAFMYRFHPQWIEVKSLVDQGSIGSVKSVQSFFSYFNDDPQNIRNMADIGGGGLMDIGCYCISFPRFLLEREPRRVVGLLDYDPTLKTDRIATGILDFGAGISSAFTCSTQLMPHQRCTVVGTHGSIEVEIPVNAPPDQATRIFLRTKKENREISFEAADQYTLQADAFARAVINDQPVPMPLTDAVANMRVIDAIVRSGQNNQWVSL